MSERKGTKALELWCKRLVKDCPNVQIDNMTTSWRNGMAFCALVHHFRPDLINISALKPENIYENNELAFNLAEKHLGIPALLDPEDMVANEVPDRLSILTYLSQFYQRLGHTVTTKTNDSETTPTSSTQSSNINALNMFGKSGLDKCTACELPVYLAQRLIVSQKLYHRRCFRCSKCSGYLNPNQFKNFAGTEFVCESCKSDKTLSKYLNNNEEQMGMLAFSDDMYKQSTDSQDTQRANENKQKQRPSSILDKINMFEKKTENDSVCHKLDSLSLEDGSIRNLKQTSLPSTSQSSSYISTVDSPTHTEHNSTYTAQNEPDVDHTLKGEIPVNIYKSDETKNAFLKTQLLDESNCEQINDTKELKDSEEDKSDLKFNDSISVIKEEFNVTDDTRIAKNNTTVSPQITISDIDVDDSENCVSVPPPRRKKKVNSEKSQSTMSLEKESMETKEYPDDLNPFSDDENENETVPVSVKRESTNPFGSSEEEEDELPPIRPPSTDNNKQQSDNPGRRLIKAYNPFWSDGEEPTSDEEEENTTSCSPAERRSPLSRSTPRPAAPRRAKGRAPPPPPADDVSLGSLSSYNSTAHSDQLSQGKLTPTARKRAPPSPREDASPAHSNKDGMSRLKRPAPGLPLPARRAVRLELPAEDLQRHLDLLDQQQLGLEKQGVIIEQMIRDRCEGEDTSPVPQEEVEDLVIQLCELVNEKNDLFRKQTELMYIRRQQRLEQEQADIEHEIRVIQSRPAVNRIDADKAREEQLVSRLVAVVALRDALVTQLDAERRRERHEDQAIADCIAARRAQRNSESNSSSLKSAEVVVTPKKNKVKDKVKKQFKKAKHTFISKKKDVTTDKKDHGEKS